MSDKKIYQEELMDHFKYPRNKYKIEDPDFYSGQFNPSCGDKISIEGKIEEDENGILRVTQIGFDGSGCVISMAAASMLTEKCLNKSVDEILDLDKDDMLKLVGLNLGPIRLRCVLLCLEALKQGLIEYKNKFVGMTRSKS
ncbi:Fe-S cluster protein [Candidatus Dependentiae bacterium]|nr:Fe-S cluster protein [Candidatus Dependentiae bacterium]